MTKDKEYHGWIFSEDQGEGYKPHFIAEWKDSKGDRQRIDFGISPAPAIEHFEQLVGQVISLETTPLGYRVFTKREG